MARQRSPNYPAVDLSQAVADVRAIYGREQRATVPLTVAATAIGYKSLSGPARTRLAALKQYGLVESSGHSIRLSDRAMTLVLRSPGSSEWLAAAREAALDPDIFGELDTRYATASDENLKHYLIVNRQFTEDGARRLIESYRGTVQYAKLGSDGYPEQSMGEESTMQSTQPEPTGVRVPSGDRVFRYPLSKSVTAEVRLSGEGVGAKDLRLLREYLEIAERAFTEEEAQLAE